ncbi:trimeric intracellular cation channel family protein [Streptomyces sp. NPDC059982]|uniref:trimeric intracellular cation channel family protein n=1 Tax=Streptomyces sp. NPDC059982 TaxID=3347024 RepID=UPI0036855182
MPHALHLLGIAAFAASGVLVAQRADMNAFGGFVLAFAASISGGTLRDLILGRHPLYRTHDRMLLVLGLRDRRPGRRGRLPRPALGRSPGPRHRRGLLGAGLRTPAGRDLREPAPAPPPARARPGRGLVLRPRARRPKPGRRGR